MEKLVQLISGGFETQDRLSPLPPSLLQPPHTLYFPAFYPAPRPLSPEYAFRIRLKARRKRKGADVQSVDIRS